MGGFHGVTGWLFKKKGFADDQSDSIHSVYCLGKTGCSHGWLWCTAGGQDVFKNFSCNVYRLACFGEARVRNKIF